jgi:oligosaccharide repeat unit polymerase
MMLHILIHILIIITGIYFFIYDYRKNKNNKLRLITGVNVILILIYGIIPIILYFNNFFVGKTDTHIIYTVNMSSEPFLFSATMILIGYLFILIGYFVSKPYRISKYSVKISNLKLKVIGLFLLMISVVSVYLVSSDLGGILNSLSYIQIIRSSGGAENISSVGFMLLPIGIAAFIIYLSFVIHEKRIFSWNGIFLLISSLNSFYYVLIFGGRLPLALFLLIPVLYYLDVKNSFKLKNMILLAILGFLLLNYLEPFFEYLSTGNPIEAKFDSIPRLISQFSFPYINTLKVHDFTYTNDGFRYFIDLVSWIYNIIPNRIMDYLGGKVIPPSYLVNSINHGIGGIPVDIVSFGYYQFSIPGVIFISFWFGNLIGHLDKFLYSNKNNVLLTLMRVRLFEIITFYPMYADIEAFMRRRIDTVIILLIIVMISKRYNLGDDNNISNADGRNS